MQINIFFYLEEGNLQSFLSVDKRAVRSYNGSPWAMESISYV